MNKKLILEKGTVFGKWTILSNETVKMHNITHWWCECSCGYRQYVALNSLMNGASTKCRSCSNAESGKKRRKGYELISGDMWSQIKAAAERKGLPFEIRIEEAWDRWVFQNGRCHITDEKLVLTGYPYDREKTTAALAMIDPTKGFVRNNFFWLHKEMARMKGNLTMADFIKWTGRIVYTGSDEHLVNYNEEWWYNKSNEDTRG
jgi:hypothetical protein